MGHSPSGMAMRSAALTALALALVLASGSSAVAKEKEQVFNFCPSGSLGGQCNLPRGIAVNESGNGGVAPGILYAADFNNHRIQAFSAGGTFSRAWGWDVIASGQPNDTGTGFELCAVAVECKAGASGGGGGQLNGPGGGIAVDQATGNVYVVDRQNLRVQEFTATGAFLRVWGADVLTGGATGTGTVTNGSVTVESVLTSAKAFRVGQTITGTGIAAGTTITALGAGTITLSQAATPAATGAGTVLTVAEGAGNAPVNELQTLTSTATGGTFNLQFSVPNPSPSTQATTANIPFNASAAEVESALAGLANIGAGNVAVTGSPGGPWTVEFKGTRFADTDVDPLTVTAGAPPLTGGTVTPATSRQGALSFEICEVAANCKAGMAGAGGGMFGTPNGVLSGIGTDSSGNVYVADSTNRRIEKFGAAGAFLRTAGWDVVETGPGDDPEDHFEICVPANGDLCKAGTTGSGVGQFPSNRLAELAASPAGDLYAVDNARIQRFNSALEPDLAFALPPALAAGTKRGVAINPANGHLFFSKDTDPKIYEIDPGTGEIVGETSSGIAGWRHLALNGASGRLYGVASATLPSGDFIRAFDDVGLEVTTQPATETTGSAARLHGTVKPGGSQASACAFEYLAIAQQQQNEEEGDPPFTGATSAPCAETLAEIGSGTTPVPVHADASGLLPGRTYRFRLRAANLIGENKQGTDLSFQTLGPVIGDAWAKEVGFADASLAAEVDPEGKATTFHIDYGISEAYGQETPELAVGSDSASHEVSALLEELEAGTTYHWRVVATNADAVNNGPVRAFTTYRPLGHESCSNDAFRVGPSADLPDCRAYEMVSPPDKGGGDIVVPCCESSVIEIGYRQAATDGERLTFTSTTAFGDALRSARPNQYLASRHPLGDPQQGWLTHALLPPQGTTVFDPGSSLQYDVNGANFQAFTPDLCFALMRDHNLIPLDSEAIEGFTNLYLRDNCEPSADTYEALTVGGPPSVSAEGQDLGLQARNYSADLSHIVFSAAAALDSTPAAAASTNTQIYDFSEGGLHLVSVLPGGAANLSDSAVGSEGGAARNSNLSRAVSEDGSRIFWSSNSGGTTTIYVRVDGVETLRVSESGSDIRFLTASTDGSKAVFGEGADLYEFDVDKALAAEPAKTKIAGEVGGIAGASEDLSHLYFTSKEALASGATAGERNLYLRREGTVSFIATAEEGVVVTPNPFTVGLGVTGPSPLLRSSRVTPDGHHLAFMSGVSLTGYENADRESDEATSEVYLYDAAANGGTGELHCVSCNPSAARPASQEPSAPYKPFAAAGYPAAAWIPTCEWTDYCKRSLSDDGSRVFFNSFDALVPEDINGAQDAYQWEAPGSGTCDESDPRYFPANGGCISLISTGRSHEGSEFLDASADGRDAFFTTASNIDPRDVGFIDVYDARAGGGFPPPPAPPPLCVGDACQSVPAPPEHPTPAGAVFTGPGNEHHKHKRSHHHKRHHRRANHNRRAAR